MKIAIAQLNYTVGDIDGNAAKIAAAAIRAREGGATLLLTTELAISGYSPEDLLLRNDFYDACAAALMELARKTQAQAHGLTLLVGHPHRQDDKRYNAASLLRDGKIITPTSSASCRITTCSTRSAISIRAMRPACSSTRGCASA